ACNACRMCGDAEAPAGYVNIMHAIVADVAATEIVPPTPDAGQKVGAVRNQRGRAAPQIEIEIVRRLSRLRLADRTAELAVPGLGHQNVADLSVTQPLHGLADDAGAAALRPHLALFARSFGRVHHQPALADIVTAGFLDVDVLAGIQGQDSRGCVPVVGGGDHHGVYALVVKDLAHVLDGLRRLARRFHGLSGVGEALLIDVTDIG